MVIESNQASLGLWWQWVSRSALGAVIGAILGTGIGFITVQLGGSFLVWIGICPNNQGAIYCFMLAGVVTGACVLGATVGLAQWLCLRKKIRRATGWILFSAVGWSAIAFSLAWLLFTPFNYTQYFLPVAAWVLASGTLLGGLQWLILRRNLRHSEWWVLANLLGTALAIAIIAGMGQRNWGVLTIAVVLIEVSCILAAITGGVLVWLYKKQQVR